MPRSLIALVIGMALIALNLRPWVTSVGPALPTIRDDLGLSSTLSSVLTALPVVCFALVSPIAPRVLRRYKMELAIVASLIALIAGLLLRVAPGIVAVFAGTLVAGAAIAITNVLLPVMVKRDAPARAGLLTGVYTMMISVGAALGAGITVPFAEAVGGGWRSGLALWVLPVIPAALFWVVRARGKDSVAERATSRDVAPAPELATPVKRVDWPVTLFFGFQSGVFYAAVGWLPSVLHDQGYTTAEAGGLMSLALILGIPLGLIAPILAARQRDQRWSVAVFVVLTGAGLAGLFLMPDAAVVWMIVFGIGSGGTFPLALMLIVTRSSSARETERLSSAAQTLGYGLAVFAPVAVGELHSATGSWTPPLVLMAGIMLVPTLLAGLAASRSPFSAQARRYSAR